MVTVIPGTGGETVRQEGTPVAVNGELPTTGEILGVSGETPAGETLVDTAGAEAADAAGAESARADLSGLTVGSPAGEAPVAETPPPAYQVGTQEVGDSLSGADGAQAELERKLYPEPVPVTPPAPPADTAIETPPEPVAPPATPVVEPAPVAESAPFVAAPVPEAPMPPPLEVDESSTATAYDALPEESVPAVPAPVEPAPVAPLPPVGEPIGAETVETESAEMATAREMLKKAQENFRDVSEQFTQARNNNDNSPERFIALRDAAGEVGRWELVIKSLERSSLERKTSTGFNPNENGSNGVAA